MNSLAKKALLLGGATLLAVGVNAQVRNRVNTLRYQTFVSQLGGGTGGSGGVINGPRPTPLSPVVVATPVPLRRP